MFPPPRNGALVCETFNHQAPLCSAFCKNGTDFEFNPPLVYLCSSGEWMYWSTPGVPVQNAPWPNCTGKTVRAGFFFYHCNCDLHYW